MKGRAYRNRIASAYSTRVLDSDRKSGTGLGLSICRGIAHAHGGEASAHAMASGTGALLRLSIRQNPDQQTGGGHE